MQKKSRGENEAIIKKHTSILTKRGHEPPLPRPFSIPSNFSPAVSQGLADKKLVGKPRAKFITAIAQSIFVYKSYPTDEEYNNVARELVKKMAFSGDWKWNGRSYS